MGKWNEAIGMTSDTFMIGRNSLMSMNWTKSWRNIWHGATANQCGRWTTNLPFNCYKKSSLWPESHGEGCTLVTARCYQSTTWWYHIWIYSLFSIWVISIDTTDSEKFFWIQNLSINFYSLLYLKWYTKLKTVKKYLRSNVKLYHFHAYAVSG